MVDNRAFSDILLSSIWATVPMLLLTATLVGFVLKYSVGPEFDVPSDGAIYLHVDSTLLIFVASWMSSLAPLLASSLINLTTYPLSKRLLADSDTREQERLLTPSQLRLALQMTHGSTWSGLWGWFCCRIGWRSRAARRTSALDSLSIIALLATVLGLSVFAADTWLHVATTSQDAPETAVIDTIETPYSLALRPECLQTNNSFSALNTSRIACTLEPTTNGRSVPRVYGAENALLALNDLSLNLSISANSPNFTMSHLSVLPRPDNRDHYTAKTYAALTTCTPISQACNLAINESVSFNCSHGAFARASTDLSDSGLISQCFKTSDMSDTTDTWKYNGVNNPFYVAGATLNTASQGALSPPIIADPEAVTDAGVVLAVVHMCTVSVFDVDYEFKNGAFVRFDTTLSNTSVTNAFMAPYCATRFGAYNSDLALNIAVQLSDNLSDFTQGLASSISTNVAAAGVGAVQLAPALSVKRTDNIVVARMPKAPFFLLISLNLAFVLLGVVLTVLAVLTSEDVRKVQFRLTVTGLVAALFAGTGSKTTARGEAGTAGTLNGTYDQESYAGGEGMRIGINRSSVGGFMFALLNETQESLEERKNPDLTFHGLTVRDEKTSFPSLYVSPVSDEMVNYLHSPEDLASRKKSDDWI